MSKGKQTFGRPSDEEAVRMVLAYYSITDPVKRAALLREAERLALESPVLEGVTHFRMLDHDLLDEPDIRHLGRKKSEPS